MKNETMGAYVPLSKNEIKDLLTKTKETLAISDKIAHQHQVFSTADLWNIQKKYKSSSSMTRRLQ